MNKQPSQTHVAVSKDGDILIIQGSGIPILFVPRTHVSALLETPETASAIIITDVGAAAIETMLAGNAVFEATTQENASSEIKSVILRFRLPNGLVVAYATDDALPSCRASLRALGIDIAVTDTALNWAREHAQLVGDVIARMPTVPPQITGLAQFEPHRLAEIVRAVMDRRDIAAKQNSTPKATP